MNIANKILSILPYKGEKKILQYSQTVEDIKRNMINHHYKHELYYDKFSLLFVSDPENTCKQIFTFLRNYVKNVTEGVKLQTLKTPAAIIAEGATVGADCKNYALFSAGVLSSLIRKRLLNGKVKFRFCEYDNLIGGATNHVFTVYEYDGKELWIDPVKEIPIFNSRLHSPSRYKDYSIITIKKNKMLASISGTGSGANTNYYGLKYQDNCGMGAIEDVANLIYPGSGEALQLFNQIFGKDKSTNDWQKWDSNDQKNGLPAGAAAVHWSSKAGRDKNERLQLLNAYDYLKNVGYTPYFIPNVDLNGLIAKAQRNPEFASLAKSIAAQIRYLRDKGLTQNKLTITQVNELVNKRPVSNNQPITQVTTPINNTGDPLQPQEQTSNINPLLIGGAALAAILLLKK